MVQTAKSKTSKARKKTQLIAKECLCCHRKYRGVAQSMFCSKSCTERAARIRKEALIDTMTDFLLRYSQDLTMQYFGVPIQVSPEQARRKAIMCIEQNHLPFKLRLSALGYVYREAERRWVCDARLPEPASDREGQ